MRHCVYCNSDLNDSRSMEICDRCGERVWGRKMFEAIKKSTDEARDRGDLEPMRPDILEGTGRKFL